MKLLLASRFPPSLGGVETMGVLMAQEWAARPDIELKVISDVPGPPGGDPRYELVRCPSLVELHRLYRWADAVFLNHCYLKLCAPLFWMGKPYALSMSGTLESVAGPLSGRNVKQRLLKRLMRRAAVNIAACEYVRKGNGVPAQVIPNPYDAAIYHSEGTADRPWHFLFGGRVSQPVKGCFDLIDALAICRRETGRYLTLSVAGDGPDLPEMKQRAAAAGMAGSVRFLGVLRGPALAEEMRRHQVIVVPSRYQEPIGIICLEGIACGCIAVGSSGGGLGESVGPCGFTFPNGDVAALAEAMGRAVSLDGAGQRGMKEAAVRHLSGYQPKVITDRYLGALQAVMPAC